MGGIPGATDTGEPFVFLGSKTDNVYVQYAIFKDNIEHTFSITGPSDIATQLSDKFIPPTVPKTRFGKVGDTVVITEVDHSTPVKWAATKLPKKLSDLENDIKFIDQEYVDTKVAELVDNAPETLNTLKEVADALNENASTAEALNQAIGNKVDKTDYPITANPNQVLTTNDKGEKVWENKLAYSQMEEQVFIEESVWDGTQTSFPTSLVAAKDGEHITVYIDDIAYPGVASETTDFNTVIVFDESVDFPWKGGKFYVSAPGMNMNLGGVPLSWYIGKMRATIIAEKHYPIRQEYLGINIKANEDRTGVILANSGDMGSAGYYAVSLGGSAEGARSVAAAGWAKGTGSFTQGNSPVAYGNYSTAIGDYTVSTAQGSVATGRYNIKDTDENYALIVGNGVKGTEYIDGQGWNHSYSNAYTLDWQGNAKYAGDVYVQGTGTDDLQNAKKLATEEYVTSLVENKADNTDIVQADWEENNSESNAYVMNRPFYDSRTNIIEWDGETFDIAISIPEMNVTLYRVSDTPLTKDELGTVTYYSFGSTRGNTNLNSDLYETADGKIIQESQSFAFVSVLEDGATMHVRAGVEDVVFEKKGIYFWELRFSANLSMKTQKIKYGAVTQIPDYYISDKIARQRTVQWISYNTPKTLNIYAADLDKDIITEVHTGNYIAGSGKNYTNNLDEALSYNDLKTYAEITGHSGTNLAIHWLTSENMREKRQALDLHIGDDGIGFHFIKNITFDEVTGQPQFNLKKVWVANPNYVAE